MEQPPVLNEHNKAEYPPAHTAEHILNGTVSKLYGCGRAFSSHVERKKSKLDYHLAQPLSDEQISDLEDRVNAVITADVEVWTEYARKDDMAAVKRVIESMDTCRACPTTPAKRCASSTWATTTSVSVPGSMWPARAR